MRKTQNLCYNCFKERTEQEGRCPFCGYDHSEYSEKYPHALNAGTILNDKYIVGRVLGQGGFGITYLAFDNQLKVKVAIKEFMPEGLASRTLETTKVSVYSKDREADFRYGEERFLDEARVLARFTNNPNIVAVKYYFSENDTAYFVMDYIEGISFKAYIQNKGGVIPYEDALRVLVPVLRALSAVHKENFIHRDVTPDNIYITKDEDIKLLDFGAARYSFGDKSRSLDVVLKAGYAPKEQYVRRGKQGPYTDVYSVAACFYAAITGYLPPEALERMEDDSIVAPSTRGIDIPDYLEDAILKGLEVNPSDRFQTAEEFLNALEARSVPVETVPAESEPPVLEQEKQIGKKVKKPFKFNKKWGIAAAVFSVVLVALIAGTAVFHKNSQVDPDKHLQKTMADFDQYKSEAVNDFINMIREDQSSLDDFVNTAMSGDSNKLLEYMDKISGSSYIGAGFTDLNGAGFCFTSDGNQVSAEVNSVNDEAFFQETVKEKSVVTRAALFETDSILVYSVPVLYEDTLFSTAQLYYNLDSFDQGAVLMDPACIDAINQWLGDMGSQMWVKFQEEGDNSATVNASNMFDDAQTMVEAMVPVVQKAEENKKTDKEDKTASEAIVQAAAEQAASEKAAAEQAAAEKAASEQAASEKAAAEQAAAEKAASEQAASEKAAAEQAASEKAASEQAAAEQAAAEQAAAEQAAAEQAAAEQAAAEQAAAEQAASQPQQANCREYTLSTSIYSADVSYTGSWKDGKPEGSGTAVFLEAVPGRFDFGDTLEGNWVNGLLEGWGTYTSFDGTYQLKGNFVHGLKEGMVEQYENGVYIGDIEFRNGSPVY